MKRNMPALCWGTLTLLIMAAIFFFSSDTAGASNAKSGLFVSLLAPLAAWIDTDILSFLIRKAAHFFIYALLGISAYMTLHSANIKRPQWSLVICILYACSDELHQLAVSGRSGQLSDVFLDSIGALCGILVCVAILRLKRRKTS